MVVKSTDIFYGMALPWKGTLASLVEVKGEYAILSSSIYWILLTKLGERVMRPEFGSGISKLLFEPNKNETLHEFDTVIQSALDKWDDRIRLVETKYTIDGHTLECRIKWARRVHDDDVVETTVLEFNPEFFVS